VSGLVNAPNGKLPLPNVTVYVPNAELQPIAEGVRCEPCATKLSGSPLTMTKTTADGRFVLENVPTGANVPLVVQIGKWRRKVTVPNVTACKDTPVDPETLRLPKNGTEGDLPKIAIVTGAADAYGCFALELGIELKEFTIESDKGHVNLFTGHAGTASYTPAVNNGARLNDAGALWGNSPAMARYDALLFSCEGAQYPNEKEGPPQALVRDYVARGGRLFLNHHQYAWMTTSFAGIATFDDDDQPGKVVATIDTGSPKRAAFSQWAAIVGASPAAGKIDIELARDSVTSLGTAAQRWIYLDTPPATLFFTTDPQAAEDAGAPPGTTSCGRVHFADVHLNEQESNAPFPTGCRIGRGLSSVEKALAYFLFDPGTCP
jgi:hypothetical protein